MKTARLALAGLLSMLAVVSAAAQQFPTVPDRTVIGRIGVGGSSGPSQAIPFATLLAQIGGTASVFTAGSVPFAGATGIFTQANSRLFYDATHSMLGMGTATPFSDNNNVPGAAVRSDNNSFTRLGVINRSTGSAAVADVNVSLGAGTGANYSNRLAIVGGNPVAVSSVDTAVVSLVHGAPLHQWEDALLSTSFAALDGSSLRVNGYLTTSNGNVIYGSENLVLGGGSGTKAALFSSTSTYRFIGLTAGALLSDASGNITSGTLPIANGGTGGVLGAEIVGGIKSGANFNSTADQSITITSPTTRYMISAIIISNPSISLTTAAGGFYSAASKGGVIIVAAAQSYSVLNNVVNNAGSALLATLAAGGTTGMWNNATVFLSLTTAQGAAATADVTIMIRPLP
jgi:hypothetical protein